MTRTYLKVHGTEVGEKGMTGKRERSSQEWLDFKSYILLENLYKTEPYPYLVSPFAEICVRKLSTGHSLVSRTFF